jgi:hypothetical protein
MNTDRKNAKYLLFFLPSGLIGVHPWPISRNSADGQRLRPGGQNVFHPLRMNLVLPPSAEQSRKGQVHEKVADRRGIQHARIEQSD